MSSNLGPIRKTTPLLFPQVFAAEFPNLFKFYLECKEVAYFVTGEA